MLVAVLTLAAGGSRGSGVNVIQHAGSRELAGSKRVTKDPGPVSSAAGTGPPVSRVARTRQVGPPATLARCTSSTCAPSSSRSPGRGRVWQGPANSSWIMKSPHVGRSGRSAIAAAVIAKRPRSSGGSRSSRKPWFMPSSSAGSTRRTTSKVASAGSCARLARSPRGTPERFVRNPGRPGAARVARRSATSGARSPPAGRPSALTASGSGHDAASSAETVRSTITRVEWKPPPAEPSAKPPWLRSKKTRAPNGTPGCAPSTRRTLSPRRATAVAPSSSRSSKRRTRAALRGTLAFAVTGARSDSARATSSRNSLEPRSRRIVSRARPRSGIVSSR